VELQTVKVRNPEEEEEEEEEEERC